MATTEEEDYGALIYRESQLRKAEAAAAAAAELAAAKAAKNKKKDSSADVSTTSSVAGCSKSLVNNARRTGASKRK